MPGLREQAVAGPTARQTPPLPRFAASPGPALEGWLPAYPVAGCETLESLQTGMSQGCGPAI